MEETHLDSPDAAIQVRSLTKFFGSQKALRGVDLDVGRGESVAIFGPNGAGKTTLVKILATVMRPSSGEVTLDGHSLKEEAEAARHSIGVVTHQTYLYNSLTARENLDFYRRMYDVDASRVEEIAALVEMKHRLHDRVGTLSRGMQQRISIARALLHEPSLMMLDEPETGLDQQAVQLLWELVKSSAGKRRTVIMTTHNLEHGLQNSDRFIILDRGRIVHEQKSSELTLPALKGLYAGITELPK